MTGLAQELASAQKLASAQERAQTRPVLLLFSDTGGGHRTAAEAVAQRLAEAPGGLAPVLLDPLAGPGASWLLRRIMRLYGPAVRRAPWAWAAAYRATDSRPALALLRLALLRLADRPVNDAVRRAGPAAVVSFHPLTTAAAVGAARRAARQPPVITVVTDLVPAHTSWRQDGASLVVVPTATVGQQWGDGGCLELGLPVRAEFTSAPPGPAGPAERDALRRELGARPGRFLAVVTGGAEGTGGLTWAVPALLQGAPDIDVAAICGRNDRLRRRLSRLAASAAGRLTVTGFSTDMAAWLRCADVVVTKPGPGTVAEAACCGTAMLLTEPAGGQEAGNAEFVVGAGAGCHARGPAELLREAGRLRNDPAALARMRAAAAGLARPGAAAAVAGLIATLACPAEQGPARQEPARQGPARRARQASQGPARQEPASQESASQEPARQGPARQGAAGQGPGGQHDARH